jgi:hypothetical protein
LSESWVGFGSMIFWMDSYLIGRTQRVWVGDYLSETIYCHSGEPQGSHLCPLLDIFENVGVLAYADNLKLYMRVSSTDRVGVVKRNMI